MDKMAAKHGLDHWSCTDPIGIRTWLRSDGIIRCPLSDGDIGTDADTVSFVFNRLILCDRVNAVIGKDWQQPKQPTLIQKPFKYPCDGDLDRKCSQFDDTGTEQ